MGRLGKVRMKIVIYMPLLGDGTDCWRPVQAVQVIQDIFEVMDHIPEGEAWAFAPGSRGALSESRV
jgi:hypothetical protein